jgi:hypothetical protein
MRSTVSSSSSSSSSGHGLFLVSKFKKKLTDHIAILEKEQSTKRVFVSLNAKILNQKKAAYTSIIASCNKHEEGLEDGALTLLEIKKRVLSAYKDFQHTRFGSLLSIGLFQLDASLNLPAKELKDVKKDDSKVERSTP